MKATPLSNRSITSGRIFVPEENGNYPGVGWLHGLGSAWHREGIGRQLYTNGLPKDIRATFYCPDNPGQGDWTKKELGDLVDLMLKGDHPWLEIYGYSQGAMGVMSCLNHYRDHFKLFGIIAGKTGLTNYADFKDKHIRAWHGTEDTKMGFSIYRFIDGVAEAGGDATLIKYAAGHGICDRACDHFNRDALWSWRDSRINTPVPAPEPVAETATLEVVNGELYAVTASKRYRVNVPLTEA